MPDPILDAIEFMVSSICVIVIEPSCIEDDDILNFKLYFDDNNNKTHKIIVDVHEYKIDMDKYRFFNDLPNEEQIDNMSYDGISYYMYRKLTLKFNDDIILNELLSCNIHEDKMHIKKLSNTIFDNIEKISAKNIRFRYNNVVSEINKL